MKNSLISEHHNLEYESISETGDKRFTFLLVLYLIFGVYKVPQIPAISFGDLILMASMIDVVIRKRRIKIYKNQLLYAFVFYSLIISFAVAAMEHGNLGDMLTRIIRDAFFYIYIFSFAYSFLNYSTFVKWLKKICLILAAFIIVQEIVYILTGYLVPGFLLNATVSQTTSARQIYRHTLVSATRNGYLKANGFMTEGAHCAQALAIAIVGTYNFEENDKKSVQLAVFFTICSVFTFSASAIFFSGILWMAILISMLRKKQLSSRIGLPILVFLVGIIVFSFVGLESNLSSVVGRIISASSSETADNSSFFRLYTGFAFWRGLPLINKVVGIGFGNYSSLYTLYQGEYTQMMLSEYMNSLSYILVSGGVVGLLLMVAFFAGLYKKSNYKGKTTIVLLVFMSISSSPYISIYWVLMMMLILFNSNVYERGAKAR